MTSKEIERYRNSSKEVNGIEFYRVNSDSCGNPRYVVHFWAFISDEERSNNDLDVLQLYRIAKNRAKSIGFCVYRAKWFGGGFVGTTYSLPSTAELINDMKNDH